MSALKSTQPADEPTKIQTASELVKLERKTLSSEVSASEDAKGITTSNDLVETDSESVEVEVENSTVGVPSLSLMV